MGVLVNIDNGGTFTDVCVSDGEQVRHTKTPTTPHDLTRCFIDGLRAASIEVFGHEDLDGLLRTTDHLRYSTTSGTNALLERKGTPVAVLVEAGYVDDAYGAADTVGRDLWDHLVPGAPAGVTVAPDGTVDPDELVGIVNGLVSTGAQRLVIALRDVRTEEIVKALLLDRYPRHLLGALPFQLSHELSRDDDHARRTASAVLNAYLHPGMEHFLYAAERVAAQGGLGRPLLVFRNDGSAARIAKTVALRTWGSGPRGGLEGARAYARAYGAAVMVSMDVGGTTTDVSVLVDGAVSMRAHGRVDAVPTSFAGPDLSSFALGGSSVVRVDDGAVHIGPVSVGAAPGPACFARGGTAATLTDALLLLGYLDAERYLGGALRLDADRAADAITTHIGDPLGRDAIGGAQAVLDAFQQQVGGHLSRIVADAGCDPEHTTLLAFGGGGPVLACGIARAAGFERVIIPHLSAVFSAFGIGFSGIAHEYTRPVPADDDAEGAAAAVAQMAARAQRDMFGEGVDWETCTTTTAVRTTMGELVVDHPFGPLDPMPPGNGSRQLLLRADHRLPGSSIREDDVPPGAARPPTDRRRIRGAGGDLEVGVHDIALLQPGDTTAGPALVLGDYLTCVVDAGWRLRTTANNDLVLDRTEEAQ